MCISFMHNGKLGPSLLHILVEILWRHHAVSNYTFKAFEQNRCCVIVLRMIKSVILNANHWTGKQTYFTIYFHIHLVFDFYLLQMKINFWQLISSTYATLHKVLNRVGNADIVLHYGIYFYMYFYLFHTERCSK